MCKNSCHKLVGQPAQSHLIQRVFEQILSFLILQGHIDMHTRAIDPCLRLGHKGSVKPMTLGNGFHRHLERKNIIRRSKSFLILKIHLMLGRGDLMVGRLNLKPHPLQVQYDIPPHIFCQINGAYVKVSCRLMGIGGRLSFLVCMEQEEFTFRSYIKIVTHILCGL